MMNEALENLKRRGFFSQCTDPEGLSGLMDKGSVTFYVGCDHTGQSLHIGHMVPYFAFRHLRDAGHRGIALLGGYRPDRGSFGQNGDAQDAGLRRT
jgi:tyrosyl-tRNA synthetase